MADAEQRCDEGVAAGLFDKATVELTSPVSGVVVALHGEAGQQIAVGGPLVSFKVEGKGNVAATAPVAARVPGWGWPSSSVSPPCTEAVWSCATAPVVAWRRGSACRWGCCCRATRFNRPLKND